MTILDKSTKIRELIADFHVKLAGITLDLLRPSNTCFLIHRDDEEGNEFHYNKVCLANLYDAISYTPQANIGLVAVYLYGQRQQAEDESLSRAIKLWVEAFKPLVQNYHTVLKDECVVVDFSEGNATSIGAFLIGLRNLREGDHQRKDSFLKFVEEGFTLRQSAVLSQLFMHISGKWEFGYTAHNVINNSNWMICSLEQFQEGMLSPAFDPDKMLDSPGGYWVISPSFFPRHIYASPSEENILKLMEKSGAVTYGSNPKHVWQAPQRFLHEEQLMKFLKDIVV